ncbi:MAG: undecaprenyl-diphosphate phosphatase [Clostridia bacterium]|nr:undecaprenyl-diphosphate phosphatase [Clostridia bacterium]
MVFWIEALKTILLGIVEGVTEWLPISSTGHIILVERVLALKASEAFKEMFNIVIQLGAIMAVIVLYFHRLNPLAKSKTKEEKNSTWKLWLKVVVAIIPSGIVGLLLDDWFDTYANTPPVIAAALILYGIIFMVLEKWMVIAPKSKSTDEITYRQAIGIGAFQMLSIVPGTSRSGSTMIGGMLTGTSRSVAAEFSFFMAIPTMLGYSGLKVLKFVLGGNKMLPEEVGILLLGCVVSFLVSLAVIKGLMAYVKKHTFLPFGVYRIVLGIVVLLVFYLH